MLIKPAVDLILKSLQQLSDPEFQGRVWVRGEGPEISSPSELVSQLFDDSALSDMLETSKGPVFSTEIDGLLLQLSGRIDNVDLTQDASSLLRDPTWAQIQRLAAQIAARIKSFG